MNLCFFLRASPCSLVFCFNKPFAHKTNKLRKDHPQLVIETLTRWQQGASAETQWLIRHALRSLLKQGHPEALKLLGFNTPQVSLSNFSLDPQSLHMYQSLTISFNLQSNSGASQKLMIDYIVHFMKANGQTRPKVFKLTTKTLAPNQSLTVQKKHPFKPISTRRYYSGQHKLEIQVNGQTLGGQVFNLQIDGVEY